MKKGKHNLRWTRTPLWLTAWLLAGCMATSLLIAYGFYISLCVSIPLTLAGAWAVCRYMERTSRLMEHFIRSVRYSEFPESFTPGGTSGLDGLPGEVLVEAVPVGGVPVEVQERDLPLGVDEFDALDVQASQGVGDVEKRLPVGEVGEHPLDLSSLAGMNSPHLTGTPTSGRLSMNITSAPPSAAYLAVVLPAGPEPTTRTSTLVLSAI